MPFVSQRISAFCNPSTTVYLTASPTYSAEGFDQTVQAAQLQIWAQKDPRPSCSHYAYPGFIQPYPDSQNSPLTVCIVGLMEIFNKCGAEGGSWYTSCMDFGYQPFLDGAIQGTPGGKMLMERFSATEDMHNLTRRNDGGDDDGEVPPARPMPSNGGP